MNRKHKGTSIYNIVINVLIFAANTFLAYVNYIAFTLALAFAQENEVKVLPIIIMFVLSLITAVICIINIVFSAINLKKKGESRKVRVCLVVFSAVNFIGYVVLTILQGSSPLILIAGIIVSLLSLISLLLNISAIKKPKLAPVQEEIIVPQEENTNE